jgi:hypothetical protein
VDGCASGRFRSPAAAAQREAQAVIRQRIFAPPEEKLPRPIEARQRILAIRPRNALLAPVRARATVVLRSMHSHRFPLGGDVPRRARKVLTRGCKARNRVPEHVKRCLDSGFDRKPRLSPTGEAISLS